MTGCLIQNRIIIEIRYEADSQNSRTKEKSIKEVTICKAHKAHGICMPANMDRIKLLWRVGSRVRVKCTVGENNRTTRGITRFELWLG